MGRDAFGTGMRWDGVRWGGLALWPGAWAASGPRFRVAGSLAPAGRGFPRGLGLPGRLGGASEPTGSEARGVATPGMKWDEIRWLLGWGEMGRGAMMGCAPKAAWVVIRGSSKNSFEADMIK